MQFVPLVFLGSLLCRLYLESYFYIVLTLLLVQYSNSYTLLGVGLFGLAADEMLFPIVSRYVVCWKARGCTHYFPLLIYMN